MSALEVVGGFLDGFLGRRRPASPSPDPLGPPFVHTMRDGPVDLSAVDEQAAVRCALSRLCAYCAGSQGFPLVFAGPAVELQSGRCRRPGMHEACARRALELYRAAGLLVVPWRLAASGSFTVERPLSRVHGEQVLFRPGPLLWAEDIAG